MENGTTDVKISKAANGFIATFDTGEVVIAETPFKLGAAIASHVSGEKVPARRKRGAKRGKEGAAVE